MYNVLYGVWYRYRSGWPPLSVQMFIPHIYLTLQLFHLLTLPYTNLHFTNVHATYITLHFTQCTYCVHYFTLFIHFIIYIIISRLHFLHTIYYSMCILCMPTLSKIYLHYSTTQGYTTHTHIRTLRRQNSVYHIYMEYSVLVAPVVTECIVLFVCLVLGIVMWLYRITTDDGTGT